MDNLQYLHNTLLEYNMLDKSFEEFQAASSDKSYQQKVFQETSARGMFPGSFVDFQNKYFPTQAATVTPTSTTRTTSTSTYTPKKNEYVFGDKTEEEVSYESILGKDWENKIKEAQKIQDTKPFFVLPNKEYFNKDGSLKTPEEMLEDKKKQPGYIPTSYEEIKESREQIIDSEVSRIQEGDDPESELYKLKSELFDIQDKDSERALEINKRIKEIEEENKELERTTKKEKAIEDMPAFTKELVEQDEDDVLRELKEKYGKYGFVFGEGDNWFQDSVFITAPTGPDGEKGEKKEFDFQLEGEEAIKQAEEIDKWMREKATFTPDKADLVYEQVVDQYEGVEEETKTTATESLDKNILHSRIGKWVNDNRESTLPKYDPRKVNDDFEFPEEHLEFAESIGMEIDNLYDMIYSSMKAPKIITDAAQSIYDLVTGEGDLKNVEDYGYLIGSGGTGQDVLPGGIGIDFDWDNFLGYNVYHDINPFDVSQTAQIERAITNVAIDRWKEENDQEFNSENEKIMEEVLEYKEELIEEWEGLIHNKDGPWDWEAIKNHDIYKYSIGGTSDAVLDDKITENVKELVENMSEREYSVTDGLIDTYATLCNPLHWAFGGVSSWLKTDEQEEFIAAIERKEEELTEEEEKFRKEIEVIDASLNTVQGDEKTFGLKYESNWLLENTQEDLLKKIDKIKNRKRVSQEEVKMDNDEIKGLIKEYTTHFDNYNDLRKSGKSLYLTRSRLVRDAEDMY